MEANKPCNSGLGCTLTVLFMGFSNIPDNEAEVIQNHVAEIFIITDMGGLQHFQMGVVFAGAIPFNDFMPASIAKTLSVLQGEKPVLIVTEGTAKLDNHKYKSLFHIKAKMIPYDEVEAYVGHAPDGVCPFGVNEGVAVYLDESLRKFAALPVPAEAQVLPGHGDFSTFGQEAATNFYIKNALRNA